MTEICNIRICHLYLTHLYFYCKYRYELELEKAIVMFAIVISSMMTASPIL